MTTNTQRWLSTVLVLPSSLVKPERRDIDADLANYKEELKELKSKLKLHYVSQYVVDPLFLHH
jgi:hypothetical protein